MIGRQQDNQALVDFQTRNYAERQEKRDREEFLFDDADLRSNRGGQAGMLGPTED
jgi:hypothetical protein